MTLDLLGLIQLFEVLVLFRRQDLAPSRDGLVDSLLLAKSDDWTRHSLVDPRQRHVSHGPLLLVR